MDCTPWVLGGLWPAELQRVTSETALLAEYLKRDLQRIADSANDRLRAISEARLAAPIQQAEESRIINVARAFAVLRVESTVRQLRREPLGFHTELLSLAGPLTTSAAVVPEPESEPARSPDMGRHHRDPDGSDDAVVVDSGVVTAEELTTDDVQSDDVESDDVEPDDVDPDDIESDVEPDNVEPEARTDQPDGPRSDPVTLTETARPEPPEEPRPVETELQRLQRLVRFVARQEPGLRWAAGLQQDGTTVLVTDLAHGWIPPGVDLPDGVELLAPKRRSGSAAALLDSAEPMATYAPGDPFGSFTDPNKTVASGAPRRLDEFDDLPQLLDDATRHRDGLPRLTHALASAAASGGRVVDAEVDVLRVHLDTARYQLLAQYPHADNALLLNCLLLAATEALVTSDPSSANYHFAWFTVLGGPPSARWVADR